MMCFSVFSLDIWLNNPAYNFLGIKFVFSEFKRIHLKPISKLIIFSFFLGHWSLLPCFCQEYLAEDFSHGSAASEEHQRIDLSFKERFERYIDLARISEKSNLDSAIIYYSEALKLAEKHQFLSAQSLLSGVLGGLYTNVKANPITSTDHYIKAYDLALASRHKLAYWWALNRLGDVNRSRHHLDFALAQYTRVVQDIEKDEKLVDSSAYEEIWLHSLNDIGLIHYSKRNYSKAIEAFNDVLSLASPKQPNEIGRAYQNLGCAHMELANFDLAESYFDSAETIFQKEIHPIKWTYLQADRVDLQLKSGELESTEILLKEIEAHANDLKLEGGLYMVYKLQKMYYQQVNKEEELIKYTELYLQQFAKLYSRESSLEISKILLEHEINQREEKISRAKEQSQFLRERESNLKRSIWFLSGGIIMFSILLTLIVLLLRKQRASNKKLVQKNLELLNQKETHLALKESDSKYTGSSLAEGKMRELADRMNEMFEVKKIYLDQNLNLNSLADKLNVNRSYLSQTINEVYHITFNQLLASYRVKEAIAKLSDKSFDKYSLAGIGELCGFGSTTGFNRTFKRETGVTPSIFRKNTSS